MKAMISSDKSPDNFAYVFCFCNFLFNVGFELLWCFLCLDFSFFVNLVYNHFKYLPYIRVKQIL